MTKREPIVTQILLLYIQFAACMVLVILMLFAFAIEILAVGVAPIVMLSLMLLAVIRLVWWIYHLEEVPNET